MTLHITLQTNKRSQRILFFVALFFSLFSCRPQEEEKILGTAKCEAEFILPDGVSDVEIENPKIRFYNVSTGEVQEFSSMKEAKIKTGLYNIDYQTECKYTLRGVKQLGRLVSQLNDFLILPESPSEEIKLSFQLHIVPQVEDFVIDEIFFTGTLHPSGRQYYGDNYVVLYNGTDHTLYADGIAFCETYFNSTRYFAYKPDIRMDTTTVKALYVVPGSGTEHPVKPGGRFIIGDTGIDHRTNNPNSFDLSKIDYEWYDVSTVPTHQDFDSPLVPNLDKWYCYTKSFFILHNRGFNSYIIARMPKELSKEQFLKDYFYIFTYVLTHEGISYDMTGKGCKVPNTWVVDGVNLCVQSNWQWNVLPENIDAGWTNCGTVDKQKDRYFHCVRRKYLGKDVNGNKIVQDTNNSTEDFNPMVTPSLIEEQGSAIDAKGTPCTQKTYDGILPIE